MRSKRIEKTKKKALKNIQFFVPKNFNLNKLKINPFEIIDDTKEKIGSFYSNLKKQREKENQRAAKKRKLDEKRDLQRQKKQDHKEKLDKIKEEKNKIAAQKKLIMENENQIRQNKYLSL